MKKKIAGVLTTVLAASLFVSGNAPVTVQQDNMTAQSQDNEDTQSDEADAEDTQSDEADAEDTQTEVEEEEAKVAADPEDQPAATETPEEEKEAEKETHVSPAQEDTLHRHLFFSYRKQLPSAFYHWWQISSCSSEQKSLLYNHTAEPEDPPAPEYRRKLYHRMNHRKPL